MRKQKLTSNPDKRSKGKYQQVRMVDTMLTPKQRLDLAKAEAQEWENRKNNEGWQTREQAEAAAQETAEVIQGDLYATLPLSLAPKLSGRIFTTQEVREVVRSEVDAMIRQWIKGERINDKALPS